MTDQQHAAPSTDELRVIAVAALANIVLQDFDAVSDEDVAALAQGVLDLLGEVDMLRWREAGEDA